MCIGTCYSEKEKDFKSAILFVLKKIEIDPSDKDLIHQIEIIYKHLGKELNIKDQKFK
tara:strand:+ start:1320 stop:1493 length:174 start_codon:yes stop_codon:yes gene_type:complete